MVPALRLVQSWSSRESRQRCQSIQGSGGGLRIRQGTSREPNEITNESVDLPVVSQDSRRKQ